jgi:hypothetical protein
MNSKKSGLMLLEINSKKGIAMQTIVLIVCTILIVLILLIFALGSSIVKSVMDYTNSGVVDVISGPQVNGAGQSATGYFKQYWIGAQEMHQNFNLVYLMNCFGSFRGKTTGLYDVLGMWNDTNVQEVMDFVFKSGCEMAAGEGFFNKNTGEYFSCRLPQSRCTLSNSAPDIENLQFSDNLEGCGTKMDLSPLNVIAAVSYGCMFDISTLRETKT